MAWLTVQKNDYVREPCDTTFGSPGIERWRNMLEGWCIDNHNHQPTFIDSQFDRSCLAWKQYHYCLNVAATTEVTWVLRTVREYGSLLFDIGIKIYFQTYCWSGDYQVHCLILELFSGQFRNNHGGHPKDFNLYSTYNNKYILSKGLTRDCIHWCLDGGSICCVSHFKVHTMEWRSLCQTRRATSLLPGLK